MLHAYVLVHGFSLDHTTWNPSPNDSWPPAIELLSGPPGHGRSTLGSAEPTAERLVQDVEEIAAGLDLPAFHLVGHSLGAVVALAARTASTRRTIRSVTSVAGTEQSIHNPVMRLGARLFSSRLGISLLNASDRDASSSRHGSASVRTQSNWTGSARVCTVPSGHPSEITQATGDIDLRPSFATAGPPTLVLVGKLDKATPAKISKRIAEAIDGARLAVVDSAGHMVIIEQPEAVVGHLTSWLTDTF